MKAIVLRLSLLILLCFGLLPTGFAQKPDSIPAYQPAPTLPVRPDNQFTPTKGNTIAATGCLPAFTYGCSYSDGLNSFAVNGIQISTNTGCSASGYSSFTTISPDVATGRSYNFSATLLSSAYPEGVAIWADLNRNQSFEASEKIYETPALQIASSVTGAFTIPAGTATGPMAIRVMAVYNQLNLSLCGTYSYGEVEDYVLNVQPPAGCDQPTFTLTGAKAITQGESVTLVGSQTGNVPYSLTIGNSANSTVQVFNNQNTATVTLPVTPAITTTYSVLAVSNACGMAGGNTATVTVASCDAPASLSESEKTTYSIRLNWQPVPVANSYTLVWREVGAVTSTTYTYGSSTTYTYLNPLTYGKTYEWQIRTTCTNGVSTAFTPLRTFTMSCPEPFSLTEVAYGSGMELQWGYQNNSATPVNYTIQWRPMGGIWQTVNNVCCSSRTLPNLTPGTAYEWQIRTNCPNGNSTAYSTPRTFTAACGPPQYPYLSYKTTTSAFIYWNSSSNTSYVVQWRPQSPANSPFLSATVTNSNNYLFTGLTNGAGYDWQVRSTCAGGQESGFTNLQSFTTACGIINYTNTPLISANSANLSWQSLGAGIGYNLVWQAVGAPTSTTITSLTTNGAAYIYRIQTVCTDGSVSGLSSPSSFTTQCNRPQNVFTFTPSINSVQVQINTTGDPTTHYDLVYRVVGSPTSSTIASLTSINTYISYTITGLTRSTAYEWQVRARCNDGSSSAFTTAQSFTTTGCLAPTGLSELHITATAALLTWDVQSNSRYVLQWRQAGSITWPTAQTFSPGYNGTYSQTIYELTDGMNYEWQIATLCADGSVSPFASRTFTTRCNGPTLLYNRSITSTGALVSWSGVYPTTYRVRWRLTGTTTWTESSTFTGNNYAISGLTSGNVYEWQPGLVCLANVTAYSINSLTFTTGCNPPGILYSSYPADVSAELNWITGDAGTTYDVQYRPAGVAVWSLVSGITMLPFSLTGLTPGTNYDYQFRSNCVGGQVSAWLGTYSFSTFATCGSAITSIRDGFWWDRSTWSCNRVPTSTDPVEIRHTVTMPNYYTGFAKQLGYGTGGRLIYQTGAKLQLGQ
jgi:GEVED domain/Fibronectin type III domain